ncbi:hypothetical protein PLESTB_000949200 [Pleodorina starrii]|uniref:Uncharacterized protein n=1 Tax=Pleodorina starrii TaxID=330485 RepID=A0A9W6BN60_9CHLO|nr:hypothetical protein PLESTB_000949200 [Pleodorina starrii]
MCSPTPPQPGSPPGCPPGIGVGLDDIPQAFRNENFPKHRAGGEYRQYETTKRSFNRFSSPPSLSAFAEVYGSAIGRCHVENRASARQLDRMNAIP